MRLWRASLIQTNEEFMTKWAVKMLSRRENKELAVGNSEVKILYRQKICSITFFMGRICSVVVIIVLRDKDLVVSSKKRLK